jgi:lysophospholipase L1-like esterase
MKKSDLIFFIFLLFFFTSANAQDWADLQRFQKQNQELPPAMEKDKRVVFMGNSITEGWLGIRPEFFKGKPYINRGISGQTTPQMLLRFRQDVIDLNPFAVVILAGTNDIAGNTGPTTLEQIMDNIISMSELAKINKIKVILCSVLPVYDYPWKPGLEPAGKIIDLNKMIKSYAERNNLIYVDYFSAMVNEQNGLKKELGDDGVHPNGAGYAVMEPLIEKAIEEALQN